MPQPGDTALCWLSRLILPKGHLAAVPNWFMAGPIFEAGKYLTRTRSTARTWINVRKCVIAASQGAHVVLPKSFLPGDTAIMVPHTPDGRVMFAVPWHDCVVVGTTDTSVDTIQLEPTPMDEEIGFILTNAAQYLSKQPTRSDVLSVFAGLRPLVKVGDAKCIAAMSRDHTILISNSGLLTVAGGKWTTYRKMAEDAVDQAETMAGFEERRCTTEHLQIHGWTKQQIATPNLRVYGADAAAIKELAQSDPSLAEKLHPELPYIGAEVVWAVRQEMARTVEDVVARRTRALLLGARASIEAAPKVAELMTHELGADEAWKRESVANFETVAQGYVLK
jgi:glycerol-3-phosphate dehydrogenase